MSRLLYSSIFDLYTARLLAKGQHKESGSGPPEDAGPVGPSVVGSPLIRGLAHQLQVDHILGAMPHTGAYAICACVPTANHNHVLVLQYLHSLCGIYTGSIRGPFSLQNRM